MRGNETIPGRGNGNQKLLFISQTKKTRSMSACGSKHRQEAPGPPSKWRLRDADEGAHFSKILLKAGAGIVAQGEALEQSCSARHHRLENRQNTQRKQGFSVTRIKGRTWGKVEDAAKTAPLEDVQAKNGHVLGKEVSKVFTRTWCLQSQRPT